MIQQKLEVILSRYAQARLEPYSGDHEIFNVFSELVSGLSELEFVRSRSYLKVKFGVGKGNWARVPWIAFLDQSVTIQNGVYCTFLFRQDMSGVYITFNQGVTELIKQNGKIRAYQELKRRVEAIHKYCADLPSKGFTLGAGIDLRVDSGLGADYEHSTIAYKFYETGRVPADAEIIKDLEATLIAYDDYLTAKPQTPPPLPTPVPVDNQIFLSKPFLLLAGISGTGKTRFVREQAKASAGLYSMAEGENHCLVPVRPDWHEPSDLLGYISRIGSGGTRYVTTDLLRFIVTAWKHAAESVSVTQITRKPLDTICPFWLCLDEMNLAPVEQYFADYLSILETRTWDGEAYSCDPLLKSAVIQQQLEEAGRKDLWENLGIAGGDPLSVGLREYFSANGIPIPPNLIVAGTVNMDETTHGFSRKVIDRALTIDFGEFFPNDYDQYYEDDKNTSAKPLSFPRLSKIKNKSDLAAVVADPDGRNTIAFLSAVNGVLAGTPFELAFRALNEALLSVVCFNPADPAHLQAVWDDFLMMKVLPRIEGDAEKLDSQDDVSLLTRLSDLLKIQLSAIAADRLDLLNHSLPDFTAVRTTCRSLKKLAWMQKRLDANGFTTFWP